MVITCCVFRCFNKLNANAKKSNISFHKIPKVEPSRSRWLKVIPRKNGLIQENVSQSALLNVCSEHFKSTDYDPDPKLVRKRLKAGVVPSIFPMTRYDFT